MTPDQISAMSAIMSLLSQISKWPFGITLFVVIVGPWIMAGVIAYTQRKRFDAVAQMYTNSTSLVKNYQRLADDLKDVVVLNTQAVTSLSRDINTNQYCPAVRLRKVAGGAQE